VAQIVDVEANLVVSPPTTTILYDKRDAGVLSATAICHRCMPDGIKRSGVIEPAFVGTPGEADRVASRIADLAVNLNSPSFVDR